MSSHSAKGLSMDKVLEKVRKTPNPSEDQQTIEVVCAYLKRCKQDHNPFDALRWIEKMSSTIELPGPDELDLSLIEKSKTIRNIGLLSHLSRYKISRSLAEIFLKELKVNSSQSEKHETVLGFRHDKDGFVVSSPNLEGWIGDKAISFIKGKSPDTEGVFIFYSFWDYLALLSHLKVNHLKADTIVLNSYECINQVSSYLLPSGYREVYTCLTNDENGSQATRALGALFRKEENLIHITNNALYRPYLSLKDWYQQQVRNEQ